MTGRSSLTLAGALAATLVLCLSTTSCTRLHFDPGAGAETVYAPSLRHSEDFQVTYLRKPDEGPLRLEKNAWTLFWFVPLNHPDLGMWLERTLPEGADAANVRASVKTPWYGHLLFFPTLGLVRVDRVRYQADPVLFKRIDAPAPAPAGA